MCCENVHLTTFTPHKCTVYYPFVIMVITNLQSCHGLLNLLFLFYGFLIHSTCMKHSSNCRLVWLIKQNPCLDRSSGTLRENSEWIMYSVRSIYLLITITIFFVFIFFIFSKKECQSCNHDLPHNNIHVSHSHNSLANYFTKFDILHMLINTSNYTMYVVSVTSGL